MASKSAAVTFAVRLHSADGSKTRFSCMTDSIVDMLPPQGLPIARVLAAGFALRRASDLPVYRTAPDDSSVARRAPARAGVARSRW
jgi:hypothetical protein